MSNKDQVNWFEGIETIVAAPLNFKAKLAIGEDAFTALRVKNAVVQVWDVAGVATTAAVVAKSSVVASTFFAPTGFWAALGIGTAVTPVGWVIAAGVVTGGAWYGITRHLKSAAANRVTVVPNFINTPLDVLALGLFDLLAPLAIKVAEADGRIDEPERQLIRDYFVKEWGYDPKFVVAGTNYIESNLDELSIEQLARTLAEFAGENRDCNFKLMAREILGFLRNIVEVDGRLNRQDEQAIENIEAIFDAANRFSVRKKLRAGLSSIRHKAGRMLSRRKPAPEKHKS
ncbi:MAG: TerB family tellurite resistance protein [Gammaproteobacteria bacterium]|nr:MAG: TerB family tellurite resistance protein [Gammaproteobacteria bacterium]